MRCAGVTAWSGVCLAALLLACGPARAEGNPGRKEGTPLSPEERAAARALAEQWRECRERWEADEARGITHGTALYQGALTVLVDEETWTAMDRERKLEMIETLECAFAGPGGTVLRADFRGVRSDEVLGEWRDGELYRPGSNLPLD